MGKESLAITIYSFIALLIFMVICKHVLCIRVSHGTMVKHIFLTTSSLTIHKVSF